MEKSAIEQPKRQDVNSASHKQDMAHIMKVLSGDNSGYERIFKKYHSNMLGKITQYTNGNKDLAEDLLMETFEKAFENIDKYKEDFTFKTWLHRIMSNHVISYVRTAKAEKRGFGQRDISLSETRSFDGNDDEYSHQSTNTQNIVIDICPNINPEEELILTEKRILVNKAVEKLDENSQSVIILRYFQNLSYEEISETLEMNVNTIKSILKRAKNKLGKILSPLMEQEVSKVRYVHSH